MRSTGRHILAGLFVAMGIAHLVASRPFVAVVPSYLPAPKMLVALSGIAEIAGGVGLEWRPTRRLASWGLVLLLIAVFPANVWMAQHPAAGIPRWLLWARLPLQIPLILWAWSYSRRPQAALSREI